MDYMKKGTKANKTIKNKQYNNANENAVVSN